MAEAMLLDRLRQRGVDAHVSSAGVVTEGRPATDEVIEMMKARDLDVSDHRSRLVTNALVSGADLIIGMAREHVREVTLLDPPAFTRAYTLKELVRLAGDVGARSGDQGFGEWIEIVGEGRTPVAHLGLSGDDDVDDPMGRRFAVYKRVAGEIEDLTDRFVGLAWPPAEVP